jgi:peroxiredoxin
MTATTPVCNFGWMPPAFDLPGVDGKRHTLASARGPHGLVAMFICNHCPYVKAVRERIVRDAAELATHGVCSIAIMPNDQAAYAEDSFDNMKRIAAEFGFPFPYVLDDTQDVARAWGVVCTPEFFGFNAKLELQYHGRLDASGRNAVPGAKRELFEAMLAIANSGKGPLEQTPGIGCSIKWKPGMEA